MTTFALEPFRGVT